MSSKKQDNSGNYKSILYLEIASYEENWLKKELNNNINSKNYNKYLEEKKEVEKNLIKIKSHKNEKI